MLIGIKTIYNAFAYGHYDKVRIYGKPFYDRVRNVGYNCYKLDISFEDFKSHFELWEDDRSNELIKLSKAIKFMNTHYRRKDAFVKVDSLHKAINNQNVEPFIHNRKLGEVKKVWCKYSDLLSAATLQMCRKDFNEFINTLDLDSFRTNRTKYVNFRDFCEKIDYRPEARRYQV